MGVDEHCALQVDSKFQKPSNSDCTLQYSDDDSVSILESIWDDNNFDLNTVTAVEPR
jgi:hypothetical protein